MACMLFILLHNKLPPHLAAWTDIHYYPCVYDGVWAQCGSLLQVSHKAALEASAWPGVSSEGGAKVGSASEFVWLLAKFISLRVVGQRSQSTLAIARCPSISFPWTSPEGCCFIRARKGRELAGQKEERGHSFCNPIVGVASYPLCQILLVRAQHHVHPPSRRGTIILAHEHQELGSLETSPGSAC